MSEDFKFHHFGLIVTGKGEREHLPKLFSSLMSSGMCSFEVIGFCGQRSPITSEKKKLQMTGSGKDIPDKDTDEIGLPARRFLIERKNSFVILVDDLEFDRKDFAEAIFNRYRSAFDSILGDHKNRASVHFLVYMLEAYFFADAHAINSVSSRDLQDFEGDVETIKHPKNDLKKKWSEYSEIEKCGEILSHIRLEHVLSKAECCASLRTLIAWCYKAMGRQFTDRFHLSDGRYYSITHKQLDNVP